jgi:hypothetical protein
MSIAQDNTFDLHSSLSEIECLKDIYKLDLKAIFSSVLNKENFTNYFSIVSSILNILDKENVQSKNDQSIEDHCDRILEFCIERIHISLGKVNGQQKVLFSQLAQIMPNQPQLDIILKYFRLCIPRASIRMKFTLFKIYLIYFIKFINGKYESINTTLDVKESLQLLNCFDTDEINAFMTSNLPVSEYNLKQRNFLTSFFTLVLNESSNFGNGKVEKAIIEFIIDYNLSVLYGINDNDSSIITMCVNFLSRLATNCNLTSLVLSKCFLKLEKNSTIALSSAKHEFNKEQHMLHFNENKRHVESFKQDLNLTLSLTLLVALSDFVMENVDIGEESFLKKAEFWSLIQAGLFHSNVLTRKQALYLLKRTTDMACSYKKDICSLYFDTYLSEKDSKEKKMVHFYQAQNSIWNDFFLCIELLEETSVSQFNY